MIQQRLSLRDLVSRSLPPEPWSEGDNIPWNDPAFSERMLEEHLSQSHDMATRRLSIVEAQVQYIHSTLLHGKPTAILDLGCGPGLYTERLARLGHRCLGIDFSPAAIRHAKSVAATEGIESRYALGDLRTAPFEAGYGLAMMLYGQFNVFRREDARSLLQRVHAALAGGGRILLEVQTVEQLRGAENAPATWHSAERDLFSVEPHLVLHERFWDESTRCSTERWHLVDAATGAVSRMALSCEAYSQRELAELLQEVGFAGIEHAEVLEGSPPRSPMFAITARKK